MQGALQLGVMVITTLLLSAMGTLRSESGVQQGDPLGPLLFCLVLHKVVTAIAADSICSQLSFHSCYMDDGVIAGPKQAALQALSTAWSSTGSLYQYFQM